MAAYMLSKYRIPLNCTFTFSERESYMKNYLFCLPSSCFRNTSFVKCNCAHLLCLQMGLGKTIQAIAVAFFYRNEWPLLIVVPSSLKYPWIEELERWIPELGPEDITVIENRTDVG